MTDAALLQEVLREVRALREDLAQGRRRAIAPADAERARLLLSTAYAAVRTASFTLKSIGEHAVLTHNETLTAALAGSRSVGRLLRRVEKLDVDGLCVRRVGESGGVAVWVIEPTKPPETQSCQRHVPASVLL